MKSAEDILAIIRDVTGLAVSGVLRAVPPMKGRGEPSEIYRIAFPDADMLCTFYGQDVEIVVVDNTDRAVQMWSTLPEAKPPADQCEFIKVVLELDDVPEFRVFTEEFAADIVRRRYDSEIGPIRVSTRRLGSEETAIVFEVFETGQILQLVQDRKSGQINLDAMQALQSMPF